MFGILVRCIGLVTIVMGIFVAIDEFLVYLDGGVFQPKPLGLHLFELVPNQLNLAQALIQRYVAAWVWDPGIQWVLNQPTYACLLVGGLVLYNLNWVFNRKPGIEKI